MSMNFCCLCVAFPSTLILRQQGIDESSSRQRDRVNRCSQRVNSSTVLLLCPRNKFNSALQCTTTPHVHSCCESMKMTKASEDDLRVLIWTHEFHLRSDFVRAFAASNCPPSGKTNRKGSRDLRHARIGRSTATKRRHRCDESRKS